MDVIYININLTKINSHQNSSFESQRNEFLSGLQMTDVELDARVTVLEETGGADPSNGKYCLFIMISQIQCSESL